MTRSRRPIHPRTTIQWLLVIALVVLTIALVSQLRRAQPYASPEFIVRGTDDAADALELVTCERTLPDRPVVTEGVRPEPVGRVTSGEVVTCPDAFDGQVVVYIGEVIGDVLHRDGGAWVLMNDDAYALEVGPLDSHGDFQGYNSGLSVWLEGELADLADEAGSPDRRGRRAAGPGRRASRGPRRRRRTHAARLRRPRAGRGRAAVAAPEPAPGAGGGRPGGRARSARSSTSARSHAGDDDLPRPAGPSGPTHRGGPTVLIRPDRDDLRLIGLYVGKVMYGVGLMVLLPLVMALVQREWNDVSALTIGAALAITLGRVAEARLHTDAPLDWSHGLVTVAVSWMLGALLVAVPLYLSGHFASFVDALFDSMSGFTTSGLTLIQDLDHLSSPMQLLRHLTHFAGGQGIIIVVLTVFASSASQVGTLYVGEGREDRIVPNIVRTARFIYLVAFAYLVAGTGALTVAGVSAGLAPVRALFHGLLIFMAGFDTGGFAPYSSSIGYYHSAAYELVVMVLMIAGTLSFGMHYHLWRGSRVEAIRNFELRTLTTTLFLTVGLTLLGLARAGTFDQPAALFRKGVFTTLSAHSGTGFGVNSSATFVSDWGLIAPAAIVIAMALGGMASSTAGGMKAIRIGLAAKSVFRDIRRVIAPESAVVLASYHQKFRRVVSDAEVRSAVTIIVLFLLLYLGGAVVGVFYGFRFEHALFESTSATANVGLSIGVLSPDNPIPLKLVYTMQMYLGRLEFMAFFALVGYLAAAVRGKL